MAETVTHAVADNIHYAADNISSAVASAYTVFRQKTVEMQVQNSFYIVKSVMKNSITCRGGQYKSFKILTPCNKSEQQQKYVNNKTSTQ